MKKINLYFLNFRVIIKQIKVTGEVFIMLQKYANIDIFNIPNSEFLHNYNFLYLQRPLFQ